MLKVPQSSGHKRPVYFSGTTKRLLFSRKSKKAKLVAFATTALIAGLVVMIVFIGILFAIVSRSLPSPTKLTERDQELSTKILDRNGKLLYDVYGNENRSLVELKSLPPYVPQASIAIEDQNFYKHGGFSPVGFIRGFVKTVFFGDTQGGSTITQQLVKKALLTDEQTLTRKFKEFILAVQIEGKYSKDEILQIYLNEIPYGGTASGIEAASQLYFGKTSKDLTLTEAVILAGLPQRPTYLSPFGQNPTAYIDRSKDVARRMREDNYITKEQEEQIVSELPSVVFAKSNETFKAPHFVFYIREQLEQEYGESVVQSGGLKVTTSLDLDLQEEAQKIVYDEVTKLADLNATNGAAVVTYPKNGEILAMIGSKDYFDEEYDGKYNVATALRQPGSSIKPVTYATAIEEGVPSSTVIMDTPTEFPGGAGQPPYKPVNYDSKFHGPTQLRYALANSYNIPAVKLLAMVGVKSMLQTAYNMGLSTLEPTNENMKRFGLSVTLGGGEVKLIDMTTAFGVFANGGRRQEPVSILKIEDRKGKTLKENKPKEGPKVLSEETSFIISHFLLDNSARSSAFGTGSSLMVSGKTVSVKTGTTDDKRDNWTIGYTPSVVVGVWVGNNDNSAMNPKISSGLTGASPIWNKIMSYALKDKKSEDFKVPSNVTSEVIDAIGGGKPCRDFATRAEYFVKGTEPSEDCLKFKKVKVSKSTGKLANDLEIAKGEYDEKEYFVFNEEDPISTDGKNRWQEGINAWAATQTDERYRPPTENSDGKSSVSDTDVILDMDRPRDKDQVDLKVTIKAKVTVKDDSNVEKCELYIDDNKVKTNQGLSPEFEYLFTDGQKGKHKIRVACNLKNGGVGSKEINVSVGQPWVD